MIKSSVTLQEVINLLNEAKEIDVDSISRLVDYHSRCSKALEDHPTIIVSDEGVGLLGILNGMFGNNGGGGAIAAEYDVICPTDASHDNPEGKRVGDTCPVCEKFLKLGALKRFIIVRQPEETESLSFEQLTREEKIKLLNSILNGPPRLIRTNQSNGELTAIPLSEYVSEDYSTEYRPVSIADLERFVETHTLLPSGIVILKDDLLNTVSVKQAQKVIQKAFEKDPGFRKTYIDNISFLLEDRAYGKTELEPDRRIAIAESILKLLEEGNHV